MPEQSENQSMLPAVEEDDLVDWFSTDLHKQIDSRMTAGKWLSELRNAHGWTQKVLGERLGGVSPARISDWEHDRRAVSKDAAKQMAGLFRVSADRFL